MSVTGVTLIFIGGLVERLYLLPLYKRAHTVGSWRQVSEMDGWFATLGGIGVLLLFLGFLILLIQFILQLVQRVRSS